MDRREFAQQTSLALGGLMAGMCLDPRYLVAEESDGPDDRLLLLGLNALARAHESDYFVDGHKGASLVAAHLMCIDNALDKATRSRIVQLFDLNWASQKLCAPFPKEDPAPDQIQKIGAALADGSGVLRQVGHDAIFAMLAIKAFRMLPEAATPQRIDGVCKMIRMFKPWRDIAPAPDVMPPPFSDSVAASRFILNETSMAIDRFVGFGQGFSGHMLTFGQSLVELADMGDEEWAESCRTAFCKYVTVTRQGPTPDDKRFKDHPPSQLRPNSAEYWQRRGDRTLGIGHVFKYPYSYYDLLDRANDAELTQRLDAQAYHIF
ncbi:MAG: hypothetical protein KDA58_01980 [Planctomycetaceae bacterium]|nr:hypothetical protein [Planctomycetaceae bacterium]